METDKLAAALVAAQAEMPMVGKSGNNTFDKYTYAKLEDYVKVVRPIFAKHGLSMLTSVDTAESLPIRKTASGKDEHVTRIKMTLTILHASGQSVAVTAWGEGQDRGDKGIYKAITGARKYALASALGLATSDDPEADDTGKESPAPQRTVAPKPDKPTDARTAFIEAVKRWSGVAKEDLPDALKFIKAKCGVKGEKATAEELTKMHQYVLAQEKSKIDFADAMKEKP